MNCDQLKGDDGDDERFTAHCQLARVNKELCPYGCARILAPRTIDFHRLNGCRGKNEDTFADTSKKRSFVCGMCYEEFVTRDTFFEHLAQEHDIHPQYHSLAFPDRATFERFRHYLESHGGAHFRQKSGAKHRPTGRGIFMMCNRSGLVHTTGPTGDINKDRVGAFRTGYTCTAFINGTEHPDGHISVRFCGDHYGHDARMRLPWSVKNIILMKQQNNVPNTHIIRFLQNHFMPLAFDNIFAQRVCLVDLDEIRSLTPLLKKCNEDLFYHKEEEWEEEFLEKAGIIRTWMPAKTKPLEWMSLEQLAHEYRWPRPIVFNNKIPGDGDEYVECAADETEMSSAQGGAFNEEPVAYEEVVEGEQHSYNHQPSTSANDSELIDVEEEEVHIPSASRKRTVAGEKVHHSGGSMRQAERIWQHKGYIAGCIEAELDMMKAMVKAQKEFQSEEELRTLLNRVRMLRASYEPIPKIADRLAHSSAFSAPHGRRFHVPQIVRPRNRISTRGKAEVVKLRDPLGRQARWEGKKEEVHEDEEEFNDDVDCRIDEDIVVASRQHEPRITFNSKIWN